VPALRINVLPRYLTIRLALMASVSVSLGLVAVWFLVITIVTRELQRGFDARLTSLVDALAVAVTIRDGHPELIRTVSEPRFDRPLSGTYFQIQAPSGELLTSRSLWDERLPPGTFGHDEVLKRDIAGPLGQSLRMVERDIVVPETSGITHILVASSLNETYKQIEGATRLLTDAFLILGIALVVIISTVVAVSLSSLRRVHKVVSHLRGGGQLGNRFRLPTEVEPLVAEIEALVEQNRKTVERARHHVGNLAHALRTRLAVIANAMETDDRATLRSEMAKTERLVQQHLARARASALLGTAANTVPVVALANDLARAMNRLFPERGLTIDVIGSADLAVRCDRDDFAEILGNLMENACKWAESRIEVRIGRLGTEVTVTICDDGPGLEPDHLEKVRERGVRLDETVPGSGLGLAIASELTALHAGSLALVSPGPMGGLSARIAMRAAE